MPAITPGPTPGLQSAAPDPHLSAGLDPLAPPAVHLEHCMALLKNLISQLKTFRLERIDKRLAEASGGGGDNQLVSKEELQMLDKRLQVDRGFGAYHKHWQPRSSKFNKPFFSHRHSYGKGQGKSKGKAGRSKGGKKSFSYTMSSSPAAPTGQ